MFQLELTRWEWLLGALLVLPVLLYFFYFSLSDFPQRQRIVSLVVRTIVVILLLLSLAGLTLLRPTAEQQVIFAIDESLSVGNESGEVIEQFLNETLEQRGSNRVDFLTFAVEPKPVSGVRPAAEASPESPPDDQSIVPTALDSGQHDPELLGTNIAAAIEAASGAMSPAYVPHIVLLTDGNETIGDVLRAALRAGVPVSTIPLTPRSDPEVQLSAVNVPAQVPEGQPFHVEVVVNSNHEDQGWLQVYRGPHRVHQETVELKEGENRFTFNHSITGERLANITATISDPPRAEPSTEETEAATSAVSPSQLSDTFLDNNSASGLVFTAGKPRILIIESEPQLVRDLTYALEQEDIEVHVRPATGMPDSLADLQNYELLVLSNVSAHELTQQQMELARTYVQDLGGGFMMLGGEQSFGLGGYYKSVLEEILPVRSDFEKEKQKPNLGMVLVIDKSGSMSGDKIEMAKSAARAAVELLGPRDRLGVIAFDGDTYVISEVQSASNKGRISDDISRIDAGGGTVMYPAMDQAYTFLQDAAAKLKHVIILTDGISSPGDFEGLAQQMSGERITVSTVAIGSGADRGLLEEIARIGRGRHYFTDDPSAIPQIFAKETVTASKSAINERPFVPLVVQASLVLSDIDMKTSPFLLGYVVTRPKPTCELILATEQGDPLLAWWRYGLGMSAAFTSDAKARWASEWLTWPSFSQFWAQVVRHTMRKSETKGVNVEIIQSAGLASMRVDAIDPSGRYLNRAETEITVIDPQLNTEKFHLSQTAPGRYVGQFATREHGAYHVKLTQRLDGQVVYQQTRGLTVGYDDELRLRPASEELLRSIAEVSGGRFNPQPAEVFSPWTTTAFRPTPLWPWLITIAVLLFVADVALRRIDFSLILPGRRRLEAQAGFSR